MNSRLSCSLPVAAAIVVFLSNLFMVNLAHVWQTIGLLFSFGAILFTALYCVYAIGFTTLRISLVAIATFALVFSVTIGNTPAKLRFEFAKPRFEERLAEMKAGQRLDAPCWIGSFHVKKLHAMDSGEVRFWTVEEASGNTGIVYSPDGRPELNEAIEFQMDDDWYFVCVD